MLPPARGGMVMRTAVIVLAATLTAAQAPAPASDDFTAALMRAWCSSGTEAAVAEAPEFRPRIIEGFGVGALDIAATPGAKAWFDYGLQSAWAFNHRGAVEAFKEAQRLDPSCAMCIWGEAWATGPTINFGIEPAQAAQMLARVEAAEALMESESDLNKALIAALRLRLSGAERRRDAKFADAMVALANSAPENNELQVLAADAEMIAGREPTIAMARLERVLARAPEHTGAIHFYIHAAEWAGENAKAEPYANRLGALAPGASHLIHMPSHTFYRLGRYREAGDVNLQAVRADERLLAGSGWDEPLEQLAYHGHNVHFGMSGAMMAGDRRVALELARHYEATWTTTSEEPSAYSEILFAAALIARARYADPQEVLALSAPSGGPYLNAMWHYARGEAYARLGDVAGVEREAAAMRVTGGGFRSYGGMRSMAQDLARVSRDVLNGRAAMLSQRHDVARRAFLRAARVQERAFPDGDPPLFWYPVRRSVAVALLEAGRAEEAAVEARKVLEDWPRDPMTLLVLARAERALGDEAAADAHEAAAREGWVGDVASVDARVI